MAVMKDEGLTTQSLKLVDNGMKGFIKGKRAEQFAINIDGTGLNVSFLRNYKIPEVLPIQPIVL